MRGGVGKLPGEAGVTHCDDPHQSSGDPKTGGEPQLHAAEEDGEYGSEGGVEDDVKHDATVHALPRDL